MKVEYLLGKPSEIELFHRKVDKERITIGSFLANGIGLRCVFFEKSSGNVSNDIFYLCVFSRFVDDSGFRMMKLGSEGVYLHEKCGTDASRYLLGPKTLVKNKKASILESRGFRRKTNPYKSLVRVTLAYFFPKHAKFWSFELCRIQKLSRSYPEII